MNRKQRGAAPKQTEPGAGSTGAPQTGTIHRLFAEALSLRQQNRLAEAAPAFESVLAIDPRHAYASSNLGAVLQAQGKFAEASRHYADALVAMPQMLDDYEGVYTTLLALLPPLHKAIKRSAAAAPAYLSIGELFGTGGLALIADHPLLERILTLLPVREVSFERLLTSVRRALLDDAAAGRSASESDRNFCCLLARQCFINEYIFATTTQEDAQVAKLAAAISSDSNAAWFQAAALSMYAPLHAQSFAAALLGRRHPQAFEKVLDQQLREPAQQRALRETIPQLTEIEDAVSQRVREQYEENPYPRWTAIAGMIEPTTVDRHLQNAFPDALFTPLDKPAVEMLIAGCGTGWQTTRLAIKHPDASILAIDLSLSSLAYAKHKTPAELAKRIDYAQADILRLASVGKTFDVIFASGVLHHMADPFESWRTLLATLRPGGVMNVGLYSKFARADVVAARSFIAERGYGATASDIRRCRQDILASPMRDVLRFTDFYSTSECRDLLFHVQESQMDLPEIKAFIEKEGLRFLGFELEPRTLLNYRARFAASGWSMTDLDRWHALEVAQPQMFSAMYQFWVQKPAN